MKRTFLLILAIAAFSYSCDKLEFDIANVFQVSAEVDLGPNDDAAYTGSETIDATSNQDVADNLSHISAYTLNSVDFSISDFQVGSDSTTSDFEVSFSSNGSQIGSTLTSQDPLQLAVLSASGQKINLPLDDATITAIQNALLTNNSVTVNYAGSVSEVPVKFKINFFLDLTIGVTP